MNTTLEILDRLIGFDTTSSKTNIPLIDFVADYLASHGVESQRVPTDDGLKTSLFATIGPAAEAGIGLSGHTDVVPVAGQNWQTDPFKLTAQGDLLYGRGTCDMKGYLACTLAAVPMFQSRTLNLPIHILFSYDEEVGCTGVRPMIAELGERLQKPKLIFVGEPTSMNVVDAHKGATRFETVVTGRESHSSMSHMGVNAIQYAARIIAHLRDIEADLPRGDHADRFTPPMSTLHVGAIVGGTAMNIVPKRCMFGWEVRPLPGITSQQVLDRLANFVEHHIEPEMHAVDPNSGVETRATNDIPAFDAGEASQAVSLALKLAGQNETFAVSYMTEAALFQAGQVSTVVCGPGDIAQAHAPDEFIERSQLESCDQFMSNLADWAAA